MRRGIAAAVPLRVWTNASFGPLERAAPDSVASDCELEACGRYRIPSRRDW